SAGRRRGGWRRAPGGRGSCTRACRLLPIRSVRPAGAETVPRQGPGSDSWAGVRWDGGGWPTAASAESFRDGGPRVHVQLTGCKGFVTLPAGARGGGRPRGRAFARRARRGYVFVWIRRAAGFRAVSAGGSRGRTRRTLG